MGYCTSALGLGTSTGAILLGVSRVRSEAGGTGLLRLGEPARQELGETWSRAGNLVGRPVKTPDKKPPNSLLKN